MQVVLLDQCRDPPAHAIAQLAAEQTEEGGGRGEDDPLVRLFLEAVLERLRQRPWSPSCSTRRAAPGTQTWRANFLISTFLGGVGDSIAER